MMLSSLIELRRELHRFPELSGEEFITAQKIKHFLTAHNPDEILCNIGGHGIAAVFNFSEEGPSVVIRCELDALPIQETNDFYYRSEKNGIAHKCGHDGHMAIVSGLAEGIKNQNFQKGKIILLFQPAEENGFGAQSVLKDERFIQLEPDYVFALHNLPGEDLHAVIQTADVFSATVQSLAIQLQGKIAHASEPEKGLNPALALAELINRFETFNIVNTLDPAFTLVTPVHINLGEKAYGISAGSAELHYTLRTWTEKNMANLKAQLVTVINEVSNRHSLNFSTSWLDYFPAVVNASACNDIIRKVAKGNNLNVIQKNTPFKFGEDFGWYSQKYRAGYFGLGAGITSPALHHNDYDFPDDLIETGILMFTGIIKEILK